MKLPGHHLAIASLSSERSRNYQFHFISLHRGSQFTAREVERGTGEKYKVLPGAFNFI